MSLWAIIPVKPLKNAKSRLSPVLSPDQRFELAQAMLRHVLSVTTTIGQVTGVLVISRDTKALAIAREMGAKTLQEGALSNLNPALMRATMVVKSWRADAVLVLPADLPFINSGRYSRHDSTGGRSLDCYRHRQRQRWHQRACWFGRPALSNSNTDRAALRAAYRPSASAAGLRTLTYESDRLALDIDLPDDLTTYQRILASGRFGHLPSFPLSSAAPA